jgi:membrane protein
MPKKTYHRVAGFVTAERESPTSAIGCFLVAADRFTKADGFMIASFLAFNGLFSFVPFLLFLVALAGMVGSTEHGTFVVAFIFEHLPEDVGEVFELALADIFQRRESELLTISTLTIMWTTGSCLEGLRRALNRAYGVTTRRPYWKRRAQSTAMVIGLSLFFVLATLCLVIAPLFWDWIRDAVGLSQDFNFLVKLARYAVGGLGLFAIVAMLYKLLPNVRLSWWGILPGAILVVICLMGTSILYTAFLADFTDYATVYGNLGGVIGALMFFFIVGAIVVFGAQLNAVIEEARHGEVGGSRT